MRRDMADIFEPNNMTTCYKPMNHHPAVRVRHGIMPRRGNADKATNSAEIARYIAEMSAQLAQLAAAADLDLLAYFLDMARIESELVAARNPPANSSARQDWPTAD